jgi:20S proteasome subunit beta 2
MFRKYDRYQGHIGAALVLGGVDNNGPNLYCIHPHGSTDKLPYVTMGSGSLAAMAVFESRWKPDMTVICCYKTNYCL